MILARCPDCAKGLKLKPSAAGKTVKCPACGAGVRVPEGEGPAGDGPAGGKSASRSGGKARRKRPASPPPAPARSGNSGELFTGLDLADYGHKSGSQKALPDRVNKGPLTDEIRIPGGDAPKKKEEPPAPLPVVLGIVGGSVLLLALAGGGVFLALSGSKPAEPPGELARFEHPQPRTFAIDVPSNWEVVKADGGTGGRPAFATIEGPGAEVQIRQSLSGSAIGDIAGAGGAAQLAPGGETSEELTPIYTQHEMVKSQSESNFSDYQEVGGENFNNDAGRRSTFTASGSFGGKVTGLRGTVRVGNETYTVLMQCDPRDLPVMKPVFEKMLDSMGR